MNMRFLWLIFFTLSSFEGTAAHARSRSFSSKGMKVGLEQVLKTEKSEGIWSIEFLDNDNLLFSEKSGNVKIHNLKTKKTTAVQNPPPSTLWGQGGLMDLHLHPDFKNNRLVYISYTKKVGENYTTVISQAQLKDFSFINAKQLFIANKPSQKQEHFGSRIVNDKNGFLYFTVGDRGKRELAQQLDADQGKVHRLRLDGSVPEDNPFVNNKSARPTIWSFGHRNPQGLVYDFETDTLWLQEHGPRGGDEINIVKKGLNYGWPVITYGREYYGPKIGEEKKDGMEQPVYHYTPSIAPSGLEIYRGSVFPNWKGDLFSGALRQTHLNRLEMSTQQKPIKEERLLENLKERIRDVKSAPDGRLYFSTDSGKIYRLTSSQ